MRRLKNLAVFQAAVVCALMPMSFASAETFVVKGEGVRFVPEIIHAQAGDIVAFRNMVPHGVASVQGMWPEAAGPAYSATSADYDYPVTEDGVYVFRCPLHWGARMVGAIVVGRGEDSAATVAGYLRRVDEDEEFKPAKRLLKRLARQLSSSGAEAESAGK